MAGTVTILDPRVVRPPDDETRTWSVDGSLAGKVVGLRLDDAWRSYEHVLDVWEAELVAAGATVRRLLVGDRFGDGGEQTRSDLEEWSRLIDVGVIGLGN